MKKILLIQIAIALLLSSCLVGKRYTRPGVAIPENYISKEQNYAVNDTLLNLKWFQLFGDSVLNNLISEALEKNSDLQVAVLRIDQARSSYRMAKADLLPSLGYSGNGQLNDPGIDKFSLLGSASWEIDFWGKLRHAKRAAYADLLASEEALKVLKTTIVSDVAILYFQMRDLDNRLAVSELTLDSRTSYYNIVNQRFLKGEVAELDKLQAEQQLAIVEATISSLRRQLNSTERSLNIILAQNPQQVKRGLQNAEQSLAPEIPAGLPSALLEHRPDVKAAENNLIAETERIGVTQAMRFPGFSLTGVFGVASTELSNLFTNDALTKSLTGSVLGPLFEFGKNSRRVESQKAAAQIAVNNYFNTYRTALGDVENALVSIKTYREEFTSRNRQTEASRKALILSRAKYDSGYSNYLDVLVAETSTFDAEMQLSLTRSQQLAATVALYRALGGGW